MGKEPPKVIPLPSLREPGESSGAAARPHVRTLATHSAWLPLLLAGLLVVCVGLFAWEARHSARLESQVKALSEELAGARERIQAYEQRFADVRAQVDAVSEKVAELNALLSEDLEVPRSSSEPALPEGDNPVPQP